MIEILGPLGVIIGSAIFAISSQLDVFFTTLENELEDIEKDNTYFFFSENISNVDKEKLSDYSFVDTIIKGYNREIKEIMNADNYLIHIKESQRRIRVSLILLALLFVVIGTIYIVMINLKILENAILLYRLDQIFIFFIGFFTLSISQNVVNYRNNKKKYEETIKSLKLVSRGLYMKGVQIGTT